MSHFKLSAVFSLLIIFSLSSRAQSEQVPSKVKGVIELGSVGFNSFSIQLDQEQNWKLLSSQFGSSYILESKATSNSIIQGISNHIEALITNGVQSADIHFVVSSGASMQKNIEPIISAIEALGYVVNVVSSEREGQLAFRSVMPDSQKGESMVIDIGSKNTKISWFENGSIKSVSTYGSKYYTDKLTDQDVTFELKKVSKQLPKRLTQTVYLIGGMPYKFAKQSRTGNERYTLLAPLESYKPKDEKERCGGIILKLLRDENNMEKFIFDWDSNFSIGFLLELPY